MDAKQATVKRFTNLLDGSIIPSATVSQIIDYYEGQLKGSNVAVKQSCNISSKFKEAEIAEIENEEYGDGL